VVEVVENLMKLAALMEIFDELVIVEVAVP
jgi:hypothetical protein